jgi:methylenetetrahydrofolate reductase (NADPH)
MSGSPSSTAVPLSFEFFPPKSVEGMDKLLSTAQSLSVYQPEYFSVTFGAGASTQEGTLDTVRQLLGLGYHIMPHLSCVGMKESDILHLLDQYKTMGISQVLALRGDLPSGAGMGEWGDFRYASDLVQFIRKQFAQTFKIAVAVYPETHPNSTNAETDLTHTTYKIQQGADWAVTQYFFNAQAYEFFTNSLKERGVNVPIVPGIMPITNYKQLVAFSERCGADVPLWIKRRLVSYEQDEASLKAFGVDVVAHLVYDLVMAGAPALHFYTLNQLAPTQSIIESVWGSQYVSGSERRVR